MSCVPDVSTRTNKEEILYTDIPPYRPTDGGKLHNCTILVKYRMSMITHTHTHTFLRTFSFEPSEIKPTYSQL